MSETKQLQVVTTVPGFMTSAEIISKLCQKYHGMVYDVSTTKGMAAAVQARKELRDARIALDKKKPEVKREALDFCAKVEADYKAIRAVVSEYEDIPDAAIKAEEAKKEAERQAKIEAERARVAGIMASIEAIKGIPANCNGMDSASVMCQISALESMPIAATDFQEFENLAQAAQYDAVQELNRIFKEKQESEIEAARIKADQEAKAAQEEAERQERDRLAKIAAKRMAEEVEALRIEKESFAKQQAEAEERRKQEDARLQAIRDEEARIAKEARDLEDAKAQAVRDAENKRIAEEQAAKQAELDRQQEEFRRQQEEASAAARARLEEELAIEAKRIAALDEAKRNHAKCNCPWCQGVEE